MCPKTWVYLHGAIIRDTLPDWVLHSTVHCIFNLAGQHTPITEYKSIAKTPSVPPKYCDHDDDGDVSEVHFQTSVSHYASADVRHSNTTRCILSRLLGKLTLMNNGWEAHTHTDMQVTYSMKQIPVPKLTPLSAPICVYMSSSDTWQLT